MIRRWKKGPQSVLPQCVPILVAEDSQGSSASPACEPESPGQAETLCLTRCPRFTQPGLEPRWGSRTACAASEWLQTWWVKTNK